MLIDYNHTQKSLSTWRFKKELGLGEFGDYDSNGTIEIGNNVWIGAKCVVTSGSSIPDNVIVAAGSVVSGALEGNSIYGGVPARRIKGYNSDFKKDLLRIDWSLAPLHLYEELQKVKDD